MACMITAGTASSDLEAQPATFCCCIVQHCIAGVYNANCIELVCRWKADKPPVTFLDSLWRPGTGLNCPEFAYALPVCTCAVCALITFPNWEPGSTQTLHEFAFCCR